MDMSFMGISWRLCNRTNYNRLTFGNAQINLALLSTYRIFADA